MILERQLENCMQYMYKIIKHKHLILEPLIPAESTVSRLSDLLSFSEDHACHSNYYVLKQGSSRAVV